MAAIRQIISKAILPNLEQDLSRSIQAKIHEATPMMNVMLAPHTSSRAATTKLQGAFQSTAPILNAQQRNASSSYVRVSFPRKPIQYYQ